MDFISLARTPLTSKKLFFQCNFYFRWQLCGYLYTYLATWYLPMHTTYEYIGVGTSDNDSDMKKSEHVL